MIEQTKKSGWRQIASIAALAVAGIFLWTSAIASASAPPAVYGTKVKYQKGSVLQFPDFDLVYIGERHVAPPQFPRGWTAYDFTARSGKEERKISWSAGTGDIGPVRFELNGKTYQIELQRSDKLGKLAKGELVISIVRK